MERYWNEEIECMSREDMKKLQDERLVAQVTHVYENVPYYKKLTDELKPYSNDVINQVDINTKYEGYLKRQNNMIAKQKKFEEKRLPENINYFSIKGLRTEAQQKLQDIRPLTIGQASRISGVNPADITVLLLSLKYTLSPLFIVYFFNKV